MPATTKPVLAILGAAAALLAVLFLARRQLYELAVMMLRIDLFAFGGGFASVPLMFTEVVAVRHWLDGPALLDGIVLGQVTPGPIVITATFVGYLLHGTLGAIVATAGGILAVVPDRGRQRRHTMTVSELRPPSRSSSAARSVPFPACC